MLQLEARMRLQSGPLRPLLPNGPTDLLVAGTGRDLEQRIVVGIHKSMYT